MFILAVESSCDEFSVSILKDYKILSNIISSQIDIHSKYGGVIPELASRLHVENFHWVLNETLEKSKVSIEKIDYIAYTKNPGLIGSLLVGKIVAQTLALFLNKPLIPLNHLHGHIYGCFIDNQVTFPCLGVVISGGHTQLYLLNKNLDFKLIGSTQDDAIGECYDKIAIKLGFNYPGGPIIDKLSKQKSNKLYKIPIPILKDKYNFSFSGIKTYCINLLNSLKNKNEEVDVNGFCKSFQNACVGHLVLKIELALKEFNIKTILVGGGVSANSKVREDITRIGKENNVNTIFPKLEYCTDNAAMIGMLAYKTLQE